MFDLQSLGNDIISVAIAGGVWLYAHRKYIATAVHEAVKLATDPKVSDNVTQAVATTSEEDRNAALKSAAHAALVTLGYDVLALTYTHKSAIASKMSALMGDAVSPETVEAVLGAIAQEVAATRQTAA